MPTESDCKTLDGADSLPWSRQDEPGKKPGLMRFLAGGAVAAVSVGSAATVMTVGVPVSAAADPVDPAGAMETPSSREVVELKAKIKSLVRAKFSGSYRTGFNHYDSDRDGKLDRGDLRRVLIDARVGSLFTHAMWINGILDQLDADGDGLLSWDEFAPLSSIR